MKFFTKGRGKGRTVVPMSDATMTRPTDAKAVTKSVTKSMNNKVTKADYTDYRTSKKYLEDTLDKTGDIYKENWSINKSGRDIMVSLGNMTTAGWYWSGRVKEMAGFLIRIVNSKVRDGFIETMRKNNVEFGKVKGVILKSISEGDGLYEMTGDNSRWKFGTTMPEVDEGMEFDEFVMDRNVPDVTLTDEFKDEVRDRYYPEDMPDYDYVAKRYKDRYREEMKEAVMDSRSFDEFSGKVADIQKSFDNDIMEDLSETMGSGFRSVILKVAKEKGMI